MYFSTEQKKIINENFPDCPPLGEFMGVIHEYGISLAADILRFSVYRRDLDRRPFDYRDYGYFRYGDSYALLSGYLLRRLVKNGGSNSIKNLMDIYGIQSKGGIDPSIYTNLNPQKAQELRLLDEKELNEFGSRHFFLHDFERGSPTFKYKSAELLWKILRSETRPYRSLYQFNYDTNSSVTYGNCKDSEAYLLMAGLNNHHRNPEMDIYTFYDNNKPVIIQKGGKGTKEPTAFNLVDISVNGIYVPRGTLLGLEHTNDIRQNKKFTFDVKTINSILPLRLTFWAVPNNERENTFQDHWRNFVNSFANEYANTELPDLEQFIKPTECLSTISFMK